MSRDRLDYAAQGAPVVGEGFDPDTPIAGLYKTRLVAGGIHVGVRIWFGPPLDPVTGEELDRGHRWQALANDEPIAITRVWPWCAGTPIDESEYAYLLTRKAWAEQHAPESALADPTRPVDLMTAPIPL